MAEKKPRKESEKRFTEREIREILRQERNAERTQRFIWIFLFQFVIGILMITVVVIAKQDNNKNINHVYHQELKMTKQFQKDRKMIIAICNSQPQCVSNAP